jgi:hypothetical protein
LLWFESFNVLISKRTADGAHNEFSLMIPWQ